MSVQRYVGIIVISEALWLLTSSACAAEDAQLKFEKGTSPWLLRMMVLEVTPDDMRSEISTIGGKVDTPRQTIIGMDLSYFMTEHWVVEIQGGPFKRDYRIKESQLGGFEVGTISNIALSLTLQYHLAPQAQFSPYFGLGINHAWIREVKPAAGIPDFNVHSITSGVLSAGLDHRLSAQWSFSTSLRYVISPDYRFQGQGFNAVISINTLIVGVGLGYRF